MFFIWTQKLNGHISYGYIDVSLPLTNFEGNPFQRNHSVMCNYYCFWYKGAKKGVFQNSEFELFFHSTLMCVFLCSKFKNVFFPHIILYILIWNQTTIWEQTRLKCSLDGDLPMSVFCVDWKIKMAALSW